MPILDTLVVATPRMAGALQGAQGRLWAPFGTGIMTMSREEWARDIAELGATAGTCARGRGTGATGVIRADGPLDGAVPRDL